MQDWPERERYTAEDLLQIIRILRDRENGCPWDKVQTHASIRKNFLEETCEALEAIDADDGIDDFFNRIKEDLVKELKKDGSDADGCVDALMTAKYLEKIGDHGVNIGQWEIFQETGEIDEIRLL